MFDLRSKDDLLLALNQVKETFNQIRAWEENDDEATLNGFANSGIGAERSDALLNPIAQAQSLAVDILRFTQNGEGRLDARTKRWLGGRGYRVIADQADYTSVLIEPSEEALSEAEKEGWAAPEGMELILISSDNEEEGDR